MSQSFFSQLRRVQIKPWHRWLVGLFAVIGLASAAHLGTGVDLPATIVGFGIIFLLGLGITLFVIRKRRS